MSSFCQAREWIPQVSVQQFGGRMQRHRVCNLHYVQCSCGEEICARLRNQSVNCLFGFIVLVILPSVLWHCWLGGRKGIRPVKNERWGAGVVVCLERGADLHMVQLMPLPLTVSCFSKIQIGFTFLVPAQVPEKGPLNVCVCVCVRVRVLVHVCVCVAPVWANASVLMLLCLQFAEKVSDLYWHRWYISRSWQET